MCVKLSSFVLNVQYPTSFAYPFCSLHSLYSPSVFTSASKSGAFVSSSFPPLSHFDLSLLALTIDKSEESRSTSPIQTSMQFGPHENKHALALFPSVGRGWTIRINGAEADEPGG